MTRCSWEGSFKMSATGTPSDIFSCRCSLSTELDVSSETETQLHINVVTESAAKARSADMWLCIKVAVFAGPEFVTTSTLRPSGFSKPTWSTPVTFPADSNLLAPRRTAREKWAKAQYCPLRVTSFVCELI